MPNDVSWRLIRSGPLPGALNMALDQVLLEAAAAGRSRPVLRLYRWQPAAVTLGYAQRDSAAVNRVACRESGVDVVRRPTGGRAVFHDREMTYAVIAPDGCGPFPGGIVPDSRVVTGVLRETLATLGIHAEEAGERRRGGGRNAPAANVCFAAPVAVELVCRGRKLSGGAQKRMGGAFLQHGSLPVEMDLELLGRLLGRPGDEDAERRRHHLSRVVGWLNRFAPRSLTVEEVEDAFVDCFGRRLEVDLVPAEPEPEEWRRARELAAGRFADIDWSLSAGDG